MTNPSPPTAQVVHLDFIALAPHVAESDIEDLIAEAATLTQLQSVLTAGVIRAETAGTPETPAATASSDFDLAFFFVLDAFTSLEPFGTNERYIRFLQGKVARMLRSFAGADVALQQPFDGLLPHAACLALIAPDETYDWEVRDTLENWSRQTEDATRGIDAASKSQTSPSSAVGLAIGERQRYRGCVLTFSSVPVHAERIANRRFTSTLIAGAASRL